MTTSIQKRRIKKFLTALRSGKYKQTTDALSKEGGFCCLGVACDVYRKDMGLTSPSISALKWNNRHDGKLPKFVANYYGFESTNPYLEKNNKATYCNDALEYSFKKIASLFERKYL